MLASYLLANVLLESHYPLCFSLGVAAGALQDYITRLSSCSSKATLKYSLLVCLILTTTTVAVGRNINH